MLQLPIRLSPQFLDVETTTCEYPIRTFHPVVRLIPTVIGFWARSLVAPRPPQVIGTRLLTGLTLEEN